MIVHPSSSSKAYQAMCYLLTLKTVYRAVLIGLFTIVTLFLFATLIDAIAEISVHLALMWNSADPITRLVFLVAGILFFRMISPVLVKAYRKKGF